MTFCCWFTKSPFMETWKRVAVTVDRLFLDMVENFSKLLIAWFCISARCSALSRRFGFQYVMKGIQNGPKTCLGMFQMFQEHQTSQMERNQFNSNGAGAQKTLLCFSEDFCNKKLCWLSLFYLKQTPCTFL